jgi:Bacterial lectin
MRLRLACAIGALVVAAASTVSLTGSATANSRPAGLRDLHLVGAAVRMHREIMLVNHTSSTGKVGAAYTAAPVSVDSFSASMTFHILGSCADGITLIVQDQGPDALGGDGGDIGYGDVGRAFTGIEKSLAFELDTFQNPPWDPAVPHLSLQTRGTEENSPKSTHSLALVSTTPVNDGLDHKLSLQYDGTTIGVIYDGTLLVDQAVDLSRLLGLTDGTAYLGVTASNGTCQSDIALTRFTNASN